MLHNRVNELRKKNNLSKTDLANAVGVSTTCVWNWEEGNTFPRRAALSKLAKALNTTEAYLEHGIENIQPIEFGDVTTNPTDITPKTDIKAIIESARRQIALTAGIDIEKIKIVIEF